MPKIKTPEARDFKENMQNKFIFSWNDIFYIKLMSLLIYNAM